MQCNYCKRRYKIYGLDEVSKAHEFAPNITCIVISDNRFYFWTDLLKEGKYVIEYKSNFFKKACPFCKGLEGIKAILLSSKNDILDYF